MTLSGGDFDKRDDLALLLLELRPFSMIGKRSFITENRGVSVECCDDFEWRLGVDSTRGLPSNGDGPGLVRDSSDFACVLSVLD